jgi:putative peptidoglycan lipid II flippase
MMSIRYLPAGYLSALNYSKSLTELPRLAMLSSILTTTYIEQAKYKSDNEVEFVSYTKSMEGLLTKISFFVQILSILFAPFILIILFKRGKFDSVAVEKTLIIYNILVIGFLPGLMMSFFSRTMYLLGKFRTLFILVVGKFLVEIGLMIIFIGKIFQIIPIALVAGKYLFSVLLLIYIQKQLPGIFRVKRSLIMYANLIVITIGGLILNQYLIKWLLTRTIFEVFSFYMPFAIIIALIIFIYIRKKGLKGILN